MASPFSQRVPLIRFPSVHRYYRDATPSCTACRSLMISLPASALPSLASCLAFALPSDRRRSFRTRGILCRLPSHASAMLRDPGRIQTSSPISVCPNAAPAPNTAKVPAFTSFRGQNKHGFDICSPRFTNRVASAYARLASGWLARLCRQGVETFGLLRKVPDSRFLHPFPWLILKPADRTPDERSSRRRRPHTTTTPNHFSALPRPPIKRARASLNNRLSV
jgi:hypothetical protein